MDWETLRVRIEAYTAGFERGIDGASKKAASLGAAFERTGARMRSVGSNLTQSVTLPIAAVGIVAGKAAVDFESSFAGVRKTVNATEGEFARLSTGFREMAKEIPVSVNELNRIGEAAGQLGIKKGAILGFTRTMADLGVATNMTSEEAADALARLANITQMPQKEFDRLGSTVVALGNNMAATESEIVEMGLRLAGAGDQVGMSEDQILSFAAALSSVGIEAEAGGTAFSRVFLEMNTAVEEGGEGLSRFAEVAGMSSSEFKRAFERDAATAIIAFVEGLARVKGEGGNVAGVLKDLELGEMRVRDALMRASGAGDLFRRSLKLGSEAWRENNALTREAEERYKTSASQFQLLKNRAYDAAITVGGPLIEGLVSLIEVGEPVIRLVERLATGFGNLPPRAQATILVFAGMAAAAGPLIWVLGGIVSAAGSLMVAWGAVAGVLAPVAAFLIGPWGIAIAAAVVGVGLLVANLERVGPAARAVWAWTEPARQKLSSFFGWVSPAAEAVWRWAEPAREKLSSFFGWIPRAATEAASALAGVFGGGGSGVDPGLQRRIDQWNDLPDAQRMSRGVPEDLAGDAEAAGLTVFEDMSIGRYGDRGGMADAISGWTAPARENLEAFFDWLPGAAKSAWEWTEPARENLSSFLSWISERAEDSEGLQKIWRKLADDEGSVDRAKEILAAFMGWLDEKASESEGLQKIWEKLSDDKGAIDAAKEKLGPFFSWLSERASESEGLNRIWRKLNDDEGAIDRAKELVGGFTGWLEEKVSESPGLRRIWRKLSDDEGAVESAKGLISPFLDWLSGRAEEIRKDLGKLFDFGGGEGEGGDGEFLGKARERINAFLSWLSERAENSEGLNRIWTKLADDRGAVDRAKELIGPFFEWLSERAGQSEGLGRIWRALSDDKGALERAREILGGFFTWLSERAAQSEGLGRIWTRLSDDRGALDVAREKLGGFFTWLGERASQSQGLGRIWNALSDDRGAIDSFREKVHGVLGWLSERARESAGFQRVWSKLTDDKGAIERVKERFANLRDAVTARMNETRDNAGSRAQQLRERVSARFSETLENGRTRFANLREAVGSRMSEARERAGERARELKERVGSRFQETLEGGRRRFADLREAVGSRMSEARERAGERARELRERATARFQELLENGRRRFSDLRDSIGERSREARERASSRFRELKENLTETTGRLAEGILAGFRRIRDNAHDPIVTAKGWLQDTWNSILSGISKVLSAVGLDKLAEKVSGAKWAKGGVAGGSGRPPDSHGIRSRGFAAGGLAGLFREGGTGGMGTPGKNPRVHLWNEQMGGEAFIAERRPAREQLPYLQTAASWHGYAVVPANPAKAVPSGYRDFAEGGLAVRAFAGGGVGAMYQAVKAKFGVEGFNRHAGYLSGASARDSLDFMVTTPGAVAQGAQKELGDNIAAFVAPPSSVTTIWYGRANFGSGWQPYETGPGVGNANTLKHMDHVHAQAYPDQFRGAQGTFPGGGGGGFFASLWDTVGEAIWNRTVGRAVKGFSEAMEGGMVLRQAVAEAVKKVTDGIKDMIIEKAGASTSGSWSGGGTLEEWAEQGLKAGNAFPATAANIEKIVSRAMQESGGDPNAVNNWDSNAAAGTPSKGLMQVIGPTWEGHRAMYGADQGPFEPNWSNPVKSVAVASRYMKNRYGYVVGATGQGYAEGGITGKGAKLETPTAVRRAFLAVAATLQSVANSGLPQAGGIAIGDRGGVGTGRHLIGITNEAGPEAIIPLSKRTPQGDRALRAALRVHGVPMLADGGFANEWNSVRRLGDGSEYLALSSRTKYADLLEQAMAAWDAFGIVSVGSGGGVIVTDGYIDGSTLARAYSDGRIVLNTSLLDRLPPERIRGTIAHEIGHHLGLDHTGSGLMSTPNTPSRPTLPGGYERDLLQQIWGPPTGASEGEPVGTASPGVGSRGATAGSSAGGANVNRVTVTGGGSGSWNVVSRQGAGAGGSPGGAISTSGARAGGGFGAIPGSVPPGVTQAGVAERLAGSVSLWRTGGLGGGSFAGGKTRTPVDGGESGRETFARVEDLLEKLLKKTGSAQEIGDEVREGVYDVVGSPRAVDAIDDGLGRKSAFRSKLRG